MAAHAPAVVEVFGGRSTAGADQPSDRAFNAVDFPANFFHVGIDQRIADQGIAGDEGVVRAAVIAVAEIDIESADLHVDVVKNFSNRAGIKRSRQAFEQQVSLVGIHGVGVGPAGDVQVKVDVQLIGDARQEIQVGEWVLKAGVQSRLVHAFDEDVFLLKRLKPPDGLKSHEQTKITIFADLHRQF